MTIVSRVSRRSDIKITENHSLLIRPKLDFFFFSFFSFLSSLTRACQAPFKAQFVNSSSSSIPSLFFPYDCALVSRSLLFRAMAAIAIAITSLMFSCSGEHFQPIAASYFPCNSRTGCREYGIRDEASGKYRRVASLSLSLSLSRSLWRRITDFVDELSLNSFALISSQLRRNIPSGIAFRWLFCDGSIQPMRVT